MTNRFKVNGCVNVNGFDYDYTARIETVEVKNMLGELETFIQDIEIVSTKPEVVNKYVVRVMERDAERLARLSFY